jgi:hypothetical protein
MVAPALPPVPIPPVTNDRTPPGDTITSDGNAYVFVAFAAFVPVMGSGEYISV